MPNIILDLEVDRVDLVDEGANSEAFIKLYKRKETKSTMNLDEILAKMKPEHASVIKEAISKAKSEMPEGALDETAVTSLKEELAKAKKDLQTVTDEAEVLKNKNKDDGDKDNMEEILKNADPAVREVFKAINAQKEAAETAARELMEKSKKEELVAKAKTLGALPIEEAKLVEVLKGADESVFEVLEATAKALESGELFKEFGKSKDEGSQGKAEAAWAKIEKKAEEIEKRDAVTKAKAISIATKENPALYREYLEGGAN